MPTPFESAQLILTLFEQRREETMRKARDFFISFQPETADEFIAGMFGPQGGYVRMVISYWDMACSLVEHGAIDPAMFEAANGEFRIVLAKLYPLLPEIREKVGNAEFAAHIERFAYSRPEGREKIEATAERIKAMLAARKAAAANA
jgi:hypothetical protein